MNKIIIYGFPHSGTSILRRMVGNCPDVHDVIGEKLYVEKDDLRHATGKDIVIKYPSPILPDNFYRTTHKDYKIVIIIKNPYDIFGSITKRFGHLNQEHHKINDWVNHAELFLKFRNNDVDNVFAMKYEEMFENNFEKMKNMFDFLGLQYEEKKIIHSHRKAYITSGNLQIPIHAPDRRKAHGQFRQWQMNQKFENMTGHSSKFLSSGVIKELNALSVVKKLDYKWEDLCQKDG